MIMNIDIFIPVRLASTRFPKKSMKKIAGKPIIKYLIERLQNAHEIRNIIVCTTNQKSDDPLVEYLKNEKIMYFRGNEKDILVRFLDAANQYNTDFIVSVDGDDIYTDPIYVDKIVDEYKKSKSDFIGSNGFPHGFVPVGIKKEALEKICELKVTDDTETGYRDFFTKTKLFNCTYIQPSENVKFSKDIRLTLDYQEDLDLAVEIFKILGNNFQFKDIVKIFTKKPELIEITKGVDERWKKYWSKNVTNLSIRKM